jgi:hypothetical protein
MKDLRSSARANARRRSGMSKGGVSRLTSKLVLALVDACGACAPTSFSSGTVTS